LRQNQASRSKNSKTVASYIISCLDAVPIEVADRLDEANAEGPSTKGQRRAASPARPAVAAGDDDPVAVQVEHLAGGLGSTPNACRLLVIAAEA
jgi:hypothetical protein